MRFYFKSILFFFFAVVFAQACFAQDEHSDAAQKKIDEKKMQEYFVKHNIQPQKTSSGLFYTINKEGTGNKILAGETVTMNYIGRFLNDTVFDSNTDPAFHHAEPLVVEIGTGKVIKGWDKGIQLLKKASKATLYIPSGMAYGPADGAPVPPNSILIFDIDILDATK